MCVHAVCAPSSCRTNAKWVEMTSVHWYKATAEKETTAVSLLEEDQIRAEMDNFRKIVEVSNRWGLGLVGGSRPGGCGRAGLGVGAKGWRMPGAGSRGLTGLQKKEARRSSSACGQPVKQGLDADSVGGPAHQVQATMGRERQYVLEPQLTRTQSAVPAARNAQGTLSRHHVHQK